MTSRQACRERREAERKAKKAEIKRNKPVACEVLDLEEEFSPELIAEANAARASVRRKAGLPPVGFVSQSGHLPVSPTPSRERERPLSGSGFVSQSAPEPTNRAETNRLNSLHSTGPRSQDGKVASSRNSLKHGLASGFMVIPGEDPAALDALRQDLLEEHQPASPTEALLIQEMAQSFWLTQRAIRFQNDCFTADGIDEKRLSLFLRYQTTHSRAFHKALAALTKLQNRERQRAAPEPGFVSQNGTPNDEFVWQNAASSQESTETLPKSQAA